MDVQEIRVQQFAKYFLNVLSRGISYGLPVDDPSWIETFRSFHFFYFFLLWRCGPTRASFLSFLDNTQRRTIVGRTSLDEWSVRRRDCYLATQNTHNKYPCFRWDSNPQSQQASGRRPTPETARSLGPAFLMWLFKYIKMRICWWIIINYVQ